MYKILERHDKLYNTIGTKPEEDISYNQAWTWGIALTLCVGVSAVLELICHSLYFFKVGEQAFLFFFIKLDKTLKCDIVDTNISLYF